MNNVDIRIMQRELEKLKAERADGDRKTGGDHTGGGNPPEGGSMEARVAKLETHVEYIRRDLDTMSDDLKEVKVDLLSIKRRIAYFSGAGFIVVGIVGWILNNRFDQVVALLATTPK